MVLSRTALATSVFLHCGALVLLVFAIGVLEMPRPRLPFTTVIDAMDRRLPLRLARLDGGGGGGAGARTPASFGHIPKPSGKVFVEPALVTRRSELTVEAGMLLPMAVAGVLDFGDPFGVPGPPSGGTGRDGIVGDGYGGPVGPGVGGADTGPGRGPRGGGGERGFSDIPVLVYRVEPDYSDEARRARLQGAVVLSIVVGMDGRVGEVRVVRSLGLGLDEQAIAAVRKWRFRPAVKDGKAAAAPAIVEVNFRLL